MKLWRETRDPRGLPKWTWSFVHLSVSLSLCRAVAWLLVWDTACNGLGVCDSPLGSRSRDSQRRTSDPDILGVPGRHRRSLGSPLVLWWCKAASDFSQE